ncbi:MAG: AAA family ATPase [Candidatus Thiodiazotropha sp. (ex Troendleina suluensis)]|nr:AAA family ATPase [Candidatus Thiodiazotropha sp. (ex Troendleina suluensis)]
MLSQQAKRHFNLFQDPFLDDVQGPDDVFLDSEQRYIRESMYQAAKHGGFLAVIGESGAGKTTLRKDLIERISRDKVPITIVQPRIIDKGRLSAGAICDSIIHDVSQEFPRRSLEGKARQIETLLTGSSRAGNHHALIIEEAHDLSVSTLKYLKRFWELEDGFKRLMGIILIGQTELKHRLDERSNWAAREVIRRCEVAELRPLNGNLEDYLTLKFKRVGKQLDDIFDQDSYEALRSRLVQRQRGSTQVISMMYPLVVNNAVRKAMNVAADIGNPKVNAELIKGV